MEVLLKLYEDHPPSFNYKSQRINSNFSKWQRTKLQFNLNLIFNFDFKCCEKHPSTCGVLILILIIKLGFNHIDVDENVEVSDNEMSILKKIFVKLINKSIQFSKFLFYTNTLKCLLFILYAHKLYFVAYFISFIMFLENN